MQRMERASARALWAGVFILLSISAATAQSQQQTGAGPAPSQPATGQSPSSEGTDIGKVSTEGEEIITMSPSATGSRAQAQELKKEAPNVLEVQPYTEIQKLPDVNVAEALQRIPGISLETDTGEGRFINIRGMDADLNGTTFDGVVLTPSNQATPMGGGRAVAFDAFPSGVIGGVEVIKSVTPDMDAEGLGGVINLVPRGLPANGEWFADASLGTGYEPLRERPLWQANLTAGDTFGPSAVPGGEGPFGFVGTYSLYEDWRGVDDIEEGYYFDPTTKALDNLQYRWYEYHRTRQGFGGLFTFAPDESNSLYLRAIWSGYREDADKHHLELQDLCNPGPTDSCAPLRGSPNVSAPFAEPVQTLTTSTENVGNILTVLGGHSIIGGALKADYRTSWTRGYDDFPTNWGAVFATPNFVPLSYNNITSAALPTWNTSVNLADPSLYVLGQSNANLASYSQLNSVPRKSFEQEWANAVAFTLPLSPGGVDGDLKFGASIRLRQRGVSQDQHTYEPTSDVSLAGLTSGSDQVYYDGHYNIGPPLNAQAIESLPNVYLSDPAGDALANGQAFEHDDENVYAGYVEYTTSYGPLGLLGGARFEATDGHYHANLASTDVNGNTVLTPNTNVQTYSDFFPSLQVKYTLDDETQIRAAYSTAIARPGFNQITAAKSVDLSNYPTILISEGNPNLKPTYGDSFDLTVERYMPGGAIGTLGLFYKYFDNYVIPTVATVNNSNGGQTITSSFSNIGSAFSEGIEANFIQQFTMLPNPLDGLGFDGNFTYNYTRGDIRPGDRTILPQTSRWNYNAELFYEKGPVGVRLAASYVSWNLFAVGSDPTQDQWSTPRFRLDLGATYDITDNVQFYFDAKNLTNTLLEFTQTQNTYYPIQREFYGPTYFLGLRIRMGAAGGMESHFGEDDED